MVFAKPLISDPETDNEPVRVLKRDVCPMKIDAGRSESVRNSARP